TAGGARARRDHDSRGAELSGRVGPHTKNTENTEGTDFKNEATNTTEVNEANFRFVIFFALFVFFVASVLESVYFVCFVGPVIGTNRTGSVRSVWVPVAVRRRMRSSCVTDPTGIAINPPTFNCSTSAGGT